MSAPSKSSFILKGTAMTKLNGFGELTWEPTDSTADFLAWLDDEGHGEPDAAVISGDDEHGWSAEIQTDNAPGYIGQAHGFKTQDAALAWAIAVGVPDGAVEVSEDLF